jgi:DNA-binding NarL/FixJ family response regulator
LEGPNQTAVPPASVRLLVVDDQDLLRESMRMMLESEPDLLVVEMAKDGQEAVELCRLHRPDLVVMDVRMPRMNGFEATRLIKEELHAPKVLMISAYDNLWYSSEAMRAGAEGYVRKLAPLEEILEAVRGVLEGRDSIPLSFREDLF